MTNLNVDPLDDQFGLIAKDVRVKTEVVHT